MANQSGAQVVYEGMPPWARGVIIVGSFVVVVYIGFVIYNSVTNANNEQTLNQAGTTAATDLKTLEAQGINPTYDQSQYETWCETIVEAIGGCTTDSSSILAIFQQMKNLADVLQLVGQFGIRSAQPCAFTAPVSYVKYLLNSNSYQGSLPYMLQWALSALDKNTLNTYLSAQSINYQF